MYNITLSLHFTTKVSYVRSILMQKVMKLTVKASDVICKRVRTQKLLFRYYLNAHLTLKCNL